MRQNVYYSQERNASNIYKARHFLLGLEDDLIEAEIPDTYNIRFGSSNDNVASGKAEKAMNASNMNLLTSYDIFSK